MLHFDPFETASEVLEIDRLQQEIANKKRALLDNADTLIEAYGNDIVERGATLSDVAEMVRATMERQIDLIIDNGPVNYGLPEASEREQMRIFGKVVSLSRDMQLQLALIGYPIWSLTRGNGKTFYKRFEGAIPPKKLIREFATPSSCEVRLLSRGSPVGSIALDPRQYLTFEGEGGLGYKNIFNLASSTNTVQLYNASNWMPRRTIARCAGMAAIHNRWLDLFEEYA